MTDSELLESLKRIRLRLSVSRSCIQAFLKDQILLSRDGAPLLCLVCAGDTRTAWEVEINHAFLPDPCDWCGMFSEYFCITETTSDLLNGLLSGLN